MTEAEADRYAARCAAAARRARGRRAVAGRLASRSSDDAHRPAAPREPVGQGLGADAAAAPRCPRDRGAATPLHGCGRCCARRASCGAHLHIDMESLDSREAVLDLVLELLAEDRVRRRPLGGARAPGLPARLARAARADPRTGPASARADPPLQIRLVKGAYWDHELVQARQHGWPAPVFEIKAECDRNFEALTRAPARRAPVVRVAIASHNLRSVAHAIAVNRLAGGDDRDLELQVLRGLGDELQDALARAAFGSARTARSATSSPAWRTSSAACSRTPATSRSCTSRHRARRSTAARAAVERAVAAPRRLAAGSRGAVKVASWPRSPRSPTSRARAAPRRRARRLADALAALDARLPLAVPVSVGRRRRAPAAALDFDRSGRPRTASSPRGARRRRGRRRRRRRRPPATDSAPGRPARPPSARRRLVRAPPPGCASGASSSPRSRCASAPSRGPRPTPTCARRSTSSSTTRAAASSSTRGRPLLQVPGERNELRYVAARRRRRDLALELPARDPLRDDRGRARDRQRGRAQARRAVARLRAMRSSRRCAPAACRRRRSRCCPARATPAPRSSATRASTRSPSPARCRSGSRSCAPRPRSAPVSATSSASSPRWAARTA